ncbi:hypothetical protein COX86_01520, partial [Candidatus Micrarchaeota archaeon CG_4_10_14_0_2_um_filter_60_11]
TNQTTANNATTNATCNAQSCSGCNEADCLALQQQRKCIANYTYYPNGQKTFAFCSVYFAPDCSPGNFDLSNILARRLGQYHANLLFNPTVNKRRIASSASNKVLATNYGFATQSDTCEGSGTAKITCTKPINAMFLRNGMTFSVQTTTMQSVSILLSKQGDESCFKVSEVDGATKWYYGSFIDKAINIGQSIVESAFLAPESPYKTFMIIFDGQKKGCVNYKWNKGLRAEPVSGKDKISVRISAAGYSASQQNSVTIELNIVAQADEAGDIAARYALLAVPAGGKIYDRIGANPVEPVLLTANTLGSEIKVSNVQGKTTPILSANGFDLKRGGMAFLPVVLGVDGDTFNIEVNGVKGTGFKFASPEAPLGTTAAAGDLIGMLNDDALTRLTAPAGTETGIPALGDTGSIITGGKFEQFTAENGGGFDVSAEGLACSGTKWCTPAQAEAAAKRVKSDLQAFFRAFYNSMDLIDDTGAVQGTEQVFNQALGDAVADYGAKQATYELCKALGTDPLAGLQQDCSQSMLGPAYQSSTTGYTSVAPAPSSWQPPQGFDSVYGDAFTQTACNSELINYGFGSTQAFGPNFWTAFKTGLQGQLTPQTGSVYTRDPIISMQDLVVVVPMKVAGVGIKPYVFTFDQADLQKNTESDEFVKIGSINTFMGGARLMQQSGPFNEFISYFLNPFMSPYTHFVESTKTWYHEAHALPVPYVSNDKNGAYNLMDFDVVDGARKVNLFTMNKYPMACKGPKCADLKFWEPAAPGGTQDGGVIQGQTGGGTFESAGESVQVPTITVAFGGDANTLSIDGGTVTVGSGAEQLFACLLDESQTLGGCTIADGSDENKITADKPCTCGGATTLAGDATTIAFMIKCNVDYNSKPQGCGVIAKSAPKLPKRIAVAS